jgi:hypothetical protein
MDDGSSISGALGGSLLRSLEIDLRENGMPSVGWDPAHLNHRSFGPTNDSEDSTTLVSRFMEATSDEGPIPVVLLGKGQL